MADGSSAERFVENPGPLDAPARSVDTEGPSPLGFHRRLPGYLVTPLRSLPDLAAGLGVGTILAKDETERLGLPAFKLLGASWAAYRALCERLGGEPAWSTIEELRDAFAPLRSLTLTTATDGNHGRALARFARLVGCRAHILVPVGTATARMKAIESEGASVEIVDGTYDDAVARAGASDPASHVVVADTSWEGYETIPGWVIDGYDTIFGELEEQLAELGIGTPDVMVVPLGVGALGAAAATYAERNGQDGRPRLLGVEPVSASCVLESIVRGEITEVPGPHRSIMAGLNCGLPSQVAFPRLRASFTAFVAIEDARAADAMVLLAREGIVAGETGAAALGGLKAALRLDERNVIGLGPQATVVLLITEGATDPVSYASIVGSPPDRIGTER